MLDLGIGRRVYGEPRMDQGLGQVEVGRGSRLLRGTGLGQTEAVRGPRLLKEGPRFACQALTVLCVHGCCVT